MNRIAWVVPTPIKGSGGFRTIFSKCAACQARGICVDVYIYCLDTEPLFSVSEMLDSIRKWFSFEPNFVGLAVGKLPVAYDAMIATAWNTASYVARQEVARKLYFVQDYEPYFYPVNDFQILARGSYGLGLEVVTMGRWLYTQIHDLGAPMAGWLDFGVDSAVYHPLGIQREKAVCAIFQPDKDRRLSRTLLDACELLLEADDELTIYLFGSVPSQLYPAPLNPRLRMLGLLTREECNELYNRCTCGISLSATNPSRIPFEMMSSGLHVIELGLENNMFDFPETAPITFVDPSAPGMASGVLSVLKCGDCDSGLRQPLFISQESEDDQFVDVLLKEKACMPTVVPIPQRNQHDTIDTSHAMLCRFDNLMDRREREAVGRREPLVGNGLEIILMRDIHLEIDESLCFAFWCNKDQSDLVWASFGGFSAGLRAHVRLSPSASDPCVANIHFYAINTEKRYRFLFATTQAVSFSDCPGSDFCRTFAFGELSCCISVANLQSSEDPAVDVKRASGSLLGRIGSRLFGRAR